MSPEEAAQIKAMGASRFGAPDPSDTSDILKKFLMRAFTFGPMGMGAKAPPGHQIMPPETGGPKTPHWDSGLFEAKDIFNKIRNSGVEAPANSNLAPIPHDAQFGSNIPVQDGPRGSLFPPNAKGLSGYSGVINKLPSTTAPRLPASRVGESGFARNDNIRPLPPKPTLDEIVAQIRKDMHMQPGEKFGDNLTPRQEGYPYPDSSRFLARKPGIISDFENILNPPKNSPNIRSELVTGNQNHKLTMQELIAQLLKDSPKE